MSVSSSLSGLNVGRPSKFIVKSPDSPQPVEGMGEAVAGIPSIDMDDVGAAAEAVVAIYDVNMLELEPDESDADEVEADEAEADEVEADEVEADEVEADEVEADEVEADELDTDELIVEFVVPAEPVLIGAVATPLDAAELDVAAWDTVAVPGDVDGNGTTVLETEMELDGVLWIIVDSEDVALLERIEVPPTGPAVTAVPSVDFCV